MDIKDYTVYLALGSNLGNKQRNIEAALDKIEERIGKIVSLSAFYPTAPMGFGSENNFFNCVCGVITGLTVNELLLITQDIEKEIGRTDKSKNGQYADRIIDIDLILAGDLIIDTPELTVPHPQFHTRAFVLDPLYEIAPELVHPLLGKTIRELRAELHRK